MTTQEKLIKSKLNLLAVASYLCNVSEACRMLGYSRDTFYRLKKRYEDSGIDGWKEMSRRPNLRNRVPEEIEGAVVELPLRARIPSVRSVEGRREAIRGQGPTSCRRPEFVASGYAMGWKPRRSV